jgi:hypothetical protein
MSRDDDAPVVVAQADDQIIGQMWRELLAHNGIIAMLRTAGPLTGIAEFASPHDLLVARADADRARDLLAAFDEGEDSRAPPHQAQSGITGGRPAGRACPRSSPLRATHDRHPHLESGMDA